MHVVSADQPLPTDAAHRRAFLAAFLRRPGHDGCRRAQLGAAGRPCSPRSSRRSGTPVVVELGPGTGAVSAVIDERLPPGARHLAVELDEGMVEFLGRTRPGLEVVHGDARDLGKLLAERGVMHVDAVVCGLPWALFDEPTQQRVLTEVGHAIGPTGAFTTFAYLPRHGAARRAPVPPHAARDVRGGDRHRARVAQHAARVRLRVPPPPHPR